MADITTQADGVKKVLFRTTVRNGIGNILDTIIPQIEDIEGEVVDNPFSTTEVGEKGFIAKIGSLESNMIVCDFTLPTSIPLN
jgi:hypothetical protein